MHKSGVTAIGPVKHSGRERWLLGAAVPTQSEFKRGQVWGGEAHLAVDVVLPYSITALTPLGLF